MEEVTRLVSTGDCVKIWDAASMAPLEQFNPHSSSHPVAQACWSSNNQYLVSASSSGDKLVVSSLKASPAPVVELADGKKQTRVCLSSSSQFLVSGGLDHCVHIWDLKTKRLHRSLKDHKEEVTCVSFNTNDSCIASGSTSGDLVLHSLTTNLSSRAFGHGSDQPIHDLRLSMVKRSLMGSVSDSGSVVLWDSNTQKELHVFSAAHKAPGSGICFSPTSDLLVVSVGFDKKIVCYDTASKIVLRSIRVDSPLTSVDFTPDGTGLVVGSTQGKIYQYDLRNSSSPTRVTVAHKTSVTCLRFQTSSRHKSSKLGAPKISSTKRSSSKLSNSQPDAAPRGPAPHSQVTGTGGAGGEVMCREAEGQQGAEHHTTEKFISAGRNSLDLFSPVREVLLGPDSGTHRAAVDTPIGPTQVSSLEMLSTAGEGRWPTGRGSLDMFSPVREELLSGGSAPRWTQLGASAGHCYSPLSAFQSPQPIKEEEPLPPAAAEPGLSWKPDKTGSPSLDREGQSTPSSSQPAPPFFTPEPGLRGAIGVQTHPGYDPPAHGAPPPTAGPAVTAAAASCSQNIADVVGQGGAAPLTSLQVHFIQNLIHETLEDFRDACHKDIINLQMEMIRQFYIQLKEIHGLVEKHSVNESLIEEIEKLREENRRLRANY
ncbi:protein NEDD1 isoform 2-T3 [Menidia menidia]